VGLAAALGIPASPQPLGAADADQLRVKLERRYREWREALMRKDYTRWINATSPYRAAVTRNLIVSQKLPWPDALFEIPVIPPEVTPLRLIDARTSGETALAAYIGPVDFGVVAGDLPDNVLILQFHRHDGEWKYDRSQFVNLKANPDIAAEIEKDDDGFLDAEPYALTAQVPATPELCPKPDYIGHLHIEAIGYETSVRVNGKSHYAEVANTVITDVISGGLRPGENPIRITAKRVPMPPEGEGAEPHFLISVYATHDPGAREPARVFVYEPEGEPPASISASVWVTPTTLRGR
jgi:hypothetical protein